jgi:hypothetical protein
MLKFAEEKQYINSSSLDMLQQWRSNPAEWGK